MISVITFAIIGLILSLYVLYVESKIRKNKNYHAICDLGNASCSKVFSSSFGKTFGISNGVWGILFYVLILILVYLELINYVFYLAFFGFMGSLYLAYLLHFKLREFCIVCVGIYVVNLLLFIFSWILI